MLKAVMTYHFQSQSAIERGVPFRDTLLPDLKQEVSRAKYIAETEIDKIDGIIAKTKEKLSLLSV
jgi:vacuolar-type H+-ATPase catalytic subunit A/Vma1